MVPTGLSGGDPAVPKPLTHQRRQLGPAQPFSRARNRRTMPLCLLPSRP